jgi:hypothetical protein
MTPVAECTVPEKILVAALHLEEQGESPFSAESLIVAAWKKYPVAFGLKGYHDQYPDSNKVLSSIMGERGLTRKGWLSKVGQKLYTLTAEGRRVVQRLRQGEEQPAAEEVRKLSRDQDKLLLHMLNAGAVHKYQEGRKDELNFGEACKFWGVSEDDQGNVLDTRLNKVRGALGGIDRVVSGGEVVLGNGRVVTVDDVELLYKVHDYLEARFARHLNLLRSRAGK